MYECCRCLRFWFKRKIYWFLQWCLMYLESLFYFKNFHSVSSNIRNCLFCVHNTSHFFSIFKMFPNILKDYHKIGKINRKWDFHWMDFYSYLFITLKLKQKKNKKLNILPNIKNLIIKVRQKFQIFLLLLGWILNLGNNSFFNVPIVI